MNAGMIVGLGNPGERYERTRHNLGFRVLDGLFERRDIHLITSSHEKDSLVSWFTVEGQVEKKYLALKPQTFMNESGRPVQRFINFYQIPIDRLLVIHDDLDLPFGELRYATDRGPAGHNGVTSIIELLGSKAFNRLRIGVGSNREQGIPAEDYILQNFTADEELRLSGTDGIVAQAVDLVATKTFSSS